MESNFFALALTFIALAIIQGFMTERDALKAKIHQHEIQKVKFDVELQHVHDHEQKLQLENQELLAKVQGLQAIISEARKENQAIPKMHVAIKYV